MSPSSLGHMALVCALSLALPSCIQQRSDTSSASRRSVPSRCEKLLNYRDNHVTVLGITPSSEAHSFCKVEGVIASVPGSRVGFVLNLPAPRAWNGQLKMFGNGGYSSEMPTPLMDAAAAAGYATVATDTGHQGDDPDFVVGRPEALKDWAYRSVHVTAVAAKGLASDFYGDAPRYSYFEGCSTGGHQAFSEIQRFPEDFDGIIAGAPGYNRIRLNTAFLNQFLINHTPDDPSHPILPKDKLPLLAAASRAACDTNLTTPYIDDPLSCHFAPGVLLCTDGTETDNCLTEPQVQVARAMYAGTKDPQTGKLIYPPWLPGSEAGGPVPELFPGWSLYWADPKLGDEPARQNFWRYWVFDDPDWSYVDADISADVPFALKKLGDLVDATDADLSAFAEKGGKLLHYHGLADPVVSPLDSIAYHDAVHERLGDRSDEFYRLFLLPGVEHCGGGTGPSEFDRQAIIEAWVEDNQAPDTISVRPSAADTEPALTLTPHK